jgi:hypothetical protein
MERHQFLMACRVGLRPVALDNTVCLLCRYFLASPRCPDGACVRAVAAGDPRALEARPTHVTHLADHPARLPGQPGDLAHLFRVVRFNVHALSI